MRALLRRDIAREDNVLRHGDLALDTATHTVTQAGRPVDVSAREFALLAALLERPGAALSKAQLEERIYRWGDEVESNAVEVHIHNLRKKLGSETIRTLRGVGYALAWDRVRGDSGAWQLVALKRRVAPPTRFA